MLKWLTMGITELSVDKFKEPENGYLNKPIGGLWACKYNENGEFKSEWHRWCYNEEPEWVRNYGVVFELKENARIYIIDTEDDLNELLQKYKTYALGEIRLATLDFEKIKDDYDCIYLTNNGVHATAFSNSLPNLYGWDVESLLILKFDCISKCKYVDF